MKKGIFIACCIGAFACRQPADTSPVLQNRIDSLEKKLGESYKPGFGEFMSGIQVHHSKLWFAGKNQNWKLADFEIHEIMERVEDIQKYETERPESERIIMIQPAIDSVNKAIALKNPALFRSSFVLLTNTCNNCHRAVNFEFNVVQLPEKPPFDNQDFKVQDSLK